ncbi:MAG: ATP synthase F0 subunit B [Pseudomonadota bacterium]
MIPQIARAGLIDLDITVLFQLVVFLVLLVILNKLAFQPLLALFAERRKRTEGARATAVDAARRASRLEEAVQASLTDANRAGAEERNQLRDAAVRAEAEALARERTDAATRLQTERDRLERSRESILPELDRSSIDLAELLVIKLNSEG